MKVSRSAIDEYVRNVQREKERERAELKQYAQDRLRFIQETAGSRVVLANHVAYTRDVRSALELIRSVEPHIRDVLSEEFRKLEEELESEALYRDMTEARSRVAQITLTMQTDLDTAQRFLDGFPANLRQHVELDALRKEIERQRPVFERQRRERERLEEVGKASELLEHILGTRYHRVKARESAERLRQAQAEQPELLERAIQVSVYNDLSELQEEIKQRRENAAKMWQGFHELEYLEEADSSSELIKRLIAVAHRGLLEQIMDHRGYYAKRDALVSQEHRTAIRDRIDELMKSDCPDCWKLAVFFLTFSERKEPERRNRNGSFGSDRYLMSWDEMSCDWDGQARSDFVWSWDARGYGEHLIVELSEKLRVTTEGTSCGQHQPTQAPWQKRTKQSSKRDENANAQ